MNMKFEKETRNMHVRSSSVTVIFPLILLKISGAADPNKGAYSVPVIEYIGNQCDRDREYARLR